MNRTIVVVLSFLSLLWVGCASEPAREPPPAPVVSEITWTSTSSGLRYEDLRLGEGFAPELGQTAVVHYTGWLTDGTRFDSSLERGEPFRFALGLGQVIAGWDEGVATMRVGGHRRLLLPPELGYGPQGTPGGPIPPNAELVFEVELLAVE